MSNNWDVLIHRTNIDSIKYIIKNKGIYPNKERIDNWIKSKEAKHYFGNNFKNKNNIIESIIKSNINKINIKNIDKIIDEYLLYVKEILKGDYESNDSGIPAIYTHYIFNDLNWYNKQWYYWAEEDNERIIFVIDSLILKYLPFIACPMMDFGNCLYNFILEGFYGYGNLKRKPNMNKLKNYINNYIEKRKKWGKDTFINSHEILFDYIPLEFVNVILVPRKIFKEVKEKFEPLGIPVEIFSKSSKDYKKILENFS